jgi:hypothetical protein
METDRPRQRRRRGIAAVSGIALASLIAAACSSAAPSRTVASLPSHNTSNATSADASVPSQAQSDQDVVSYTRCLRAHGVDEPDPRARAGHTGLSFAIPPATAANRPAIAACNHFIAKIIAAKQAGAQRQLAQWLPALVQYATCMRSHDISMPDPGPDGQLNLGPVPGITSEFGRYSPQFRTADAACRHLLPAAVHDDGTGP